MSVANESVLQFLDLCLQIDECKEICVDVFPKPTNSFTYVLPSTCYPKKIINNVTKGIALKLRKICDTDEKFAMRSYEYQNYLIGRDYKSGREARQFKTKAFKSNFNLITVYNPAMKNLEKVFNDNVQILYGDPDMKKVFPQGNLSVTYRRGKCLKKLTSPSLYPRTVRKSASRVSKCNESRCDICKNYMVFKNEFFCTATGKTYNIRGDLTCKSDNVVYLISCKKCKQQYVSSAFESNFKPRFRVHNSDIKTGKDRCGVTKHFLNNCTGINKLENVEVQLIEDVKESNSDLEGELRSRQKYWQAQLFTLTHGINSTWDWFSSIRKGYRKKK